MFPRLYPILDVDAVVRAYPDRSLIDAVCFVSSEMVAGGASILQYRAKSLGAREMLAHARELRRIVPDSVTLIMNDRADLCLAAGFDGVHVGQEDLSVEAVREVVGSSHRAIEPSSERNADGTDKTKGGLTPALRASAHHDVGEGFVVGVSTHSVAQLNSALDTSADYVAIGPIFDTRSKLNPDPVVGLDGLREIRAVMAARDDRRPLVAIGGITLANACHVIEAGADSVALISDLIAAPRTSTEAFLRILL